MSGSHPLARRYRRHGQFACPQGSAGRTTHKIRRGRIAISAALQPGHEPDREGFFEAEGLSAQDRRANRRRPDEGARSLRRHLQICRTHKLLRRLRLLYNLIGVCLVPAGRAVCTMPAVVLTILAEPSLLATPLQAHFMQWLAGQSTRLAAMGSALG